MISERGYRQNFGATPQDTVSDNLSTDLKQMGENSQFARVDKGGIYSQKDLGRKITKCDWKKQPRNK